MENLGFGDIYEYSKLLEQKIAIFQWAHELSGRFQWTKQWTHQFIDNATIALQLDHKHYFI